MTINNAETMASYLQKHGKLEFAALDVCGQASDWLVIAGGAPQRFSIRRLRTRPHYVIVRLRKSTSENAQAA